MPLQNPTHGRRHHSKRSSRPSKKSDNRDSGSTFRHRLDTLLLGLVDGALAASILLVPFLMGGRHPIGQTVLVALTSIMVVAWAFRQAVAGQGVWRPTHATWVLLFGMALVVIQLVPMSHEWLVRFSPETAKLLPMWSHDAESSAGLGTWNCISLTPEATRAGLVVFVSYVFLFLIAVQRVERIEDVERILRWCALAAIMMAAFGLVQYFFSNGKFFWFHQSPYIGTDGCVKGAFTNRNHFAHFLALGIGPLIWWLYRVGDGSNHCQSSRAGFEIPMAIRRLFLVLAVVVVVFAGLLSLSRGGNSVLFLAAIIAAVVCGRAVAMQGRFLLAMVAAGGLVVISLNIFGYDLVSSRLSDLSSGSIERLDCDSGRRQIWKAVATAVPDFAIFGSGVGSHREVCPIYMKDPLDGFVATHAENSPLQASLETGLSGATLLALGVGFCAFWCVAGLWSGQSTRTKACLGAIAGSLTASLVHGTVDFVWYVPGCMAVVAVLAALACRCWQMDRPSDKAIVAWRLPRAVALAIAVFVVVVSVDMIGNRYRATIAQHYWERTRIAANEARRRPAEQKDLSVPENWQRELEIEQQILVDLQQVVRWYPEHARAQVSLARCHLHLFDLLQVKSPNPMPLLQIRDAAIASQDHFPSIEARDAWMRRAFGDHCKHLYQALRHTQAGLRRCPLQGWGYLYMAELSFLEGGKSPSKQACLEQALCVRPYDGNVLDMAAREAYEAILAGDLQSWLGPAKRAIQSTTSVKKRFIENLVGMVPPEGQGAIIEFIVTQLRPDLEGLELLYQTARHRATAEQLKPLRQYLAQSAEFEADKADTAEATRLWLLATQVHEDMGCRADSLRCIQNAHRCNPGNLTARYRLACLLLEEGAGEQARTHLLWCLRREPDNQVFQSKYRQAIAAVAKQPRTAGALPSGLNR